MAALVVAACSGDEPSLIAGDSDAAGSAELDEAEAASESDDHDPTSVSQTTIPAGPGTPGLITTEFDLVHQLQGTAWVAHNVNDEIDDASFSFAWTEDVGLIGAYLDDCGSGRFLVTGAERGGWAIESVQDPNPECDGPVQEIFGDGALLRLTVLGETMFVESEDRGFIEATHWQSTSIHDEIVALPPRPTPSPPPTPPTTERGPGDDTPTRLIVDVAHPQVDDLGDIPEATDISVPICATSGRIGLEEDPFAEERLATSRRLDPVVGQLPFVVWSSGPGNLHHHEMGIGLSVRYQPTIDWLAENVPAGHVCIEIPPPGYYDAGPSLIEWELVTEPTPESTEIAIQMTSECAPFVELQPQILVSESIVEIGLPLPISPYGQDTPAICNIPQPIVIELPGVLANRDVVPATEVRG